MNGVNRMDRGRRYVLQLLCVYLLRIFQHASAEKEGDVRLTGGDCPFEGEVEIYHSEGSQPGRWGTICYDGFTETEAVVTCRQLGYSNGATLRPSQPSQLSPWLASLACSAHYQRLLDCLLPGAQWGGENCTNAQTAGVHCYDEDRDEDCHGRPVEKEGDVKVMGMCSSEGQLLYYSRNRWGLVCADSFDDIDAATACRQMGFVTGWSVDVMNSILPSKDMWMTNVSCNGNEKRLLDCPHDPRHQVSCPGSSSHLAGVSCTSSINGKRRTCGGSTILDKEGDTKLTNITVARSRLDVFYHGHWGVVCDIRYPQDYFDVVAEKLSFEHCQQGEPHNYNDVDTSKVLRLSYANCGNKWRRCGPQVVAPQDQCKPLSVYCYNGQLRRTCADIHCHIGSMCIDGPHGAYCKCPPEYSGPFCDHITSQCLHNPCQNNGSCFVTDTGFRCSCSSGFSGDTCQTAPSSVTGLRVGIAILSVFFIAFLALGIFCWWRRRRRNLPRRRGRQNFTDTEAHSRKRITRYCLQQCALLQSVLAEEKFRDEEDMEETVHYGDAAS